MPLDIRNPVLGRPGASLRAAKPTLGRRVGLGIEGPSGQTQPSEGLVGGLGVMGDADTDELGHGILVRGLTGGERRGQRTLG